MIKNKLLDIYKRMVSVCKNMVSKVFALSKLTISKFTSKKEDFLSGDFEIHDSKEISFIKIFYKILIIFTVLVVICLFTIPVNDSVTYNYGEIVSKNPQIDFKAPFEIVPKKTFVSKGDPVFKGDTLMIVGNTSDEYKTLFQQNKSIDIDKLNIEEKVAFYKKEKQLDSSQYLNNKNKISNDINSLNQKVGLLREQERIKRSKFSTDSIMYRQEVISLVDLRTSYNDYLTTRNQVIESRNIASQLRGQFSSLENEYLQKKNTLEIQISDLIASQNRLVQQKESVNSKLETKEKAIDFVQSEVNRQYIISNIDGIVIDVFTENQNLSFINKGESLITISPESESFYARARVDEQDLKYIEVGQTAHLKLDAYYYYQYGPIKGKVSFIPDRKEKDNNFYVLIDLPENQQLNLRSGYSLKGDIILKRMVLGKYIIKKLFEKYDNQMSPKKKEKAVVSQ